MNNKLEKIDSDSFKGLENLERLYLGYNEITEIENSFECLSSLVDLALNNNRMKRICSNMFKGLCKLEVLNLNGNEMEIDSDAFSGLSNLRDVYFKEKLTDFKSLFH